MVQKTTEDKSRATTISKIFLRYINSQNVKNLLQAIKFNIKLYISSSKNQFISKKKSLNKNVKYLSPSKSPLLKYA